MADTDVAGGHADSEFDRRFGSMVMKGVLIGLPIAYVGLVLGLWLLTDRNLVQSLETAILPGLLIGVFFGGFSGMASALLAAERVERLRKRKRK
jgi:hypothetical protein